MGLLSATLAGFDSTGEQFVTAICLLYFQYADLNRSIDALNAWRNATMLKPDHSLAWNNMVILLDNTGKKTIFIRSNKHSR